MYDFRGHAVILFYWIIFEGKLYEIKILLSKKLFSISVVDQKR